MRWLAVGLFFVGLGVIAWFAVAPDPVVEPLDDLVAVPKAAPRQAVPNAIGPSDVLIENAEGIAVILFADDAEAGEDYDGAPTHVVDVAAVTETGQPLAGGTVYVFDSRYASLRRMALEGEREAPRALGRVRLDEEGKARLSARATRTVYLLAVDGPREGVTVVRGSRRTALLPDEPPPPKSARIVTEPVREVVVVGRHKDGRPAAGIQGHLLVPKRRGKRAQGLRFAFDDTGVQRIVLGAMESEWREASRLVLNILLPGGRRAPSIVTQITEPVTTIEVTVPPSVTLKVSLVADDGATPVKGPVTVSYSVEMPRLGNNSSRLTVRGGEYLLTGLPPGVPLSFGAFTKDRLPRRLRVMTPAEGGAALSMTLPLGAPLPTYAFTLTSAEGLPLPGFRFTVGPRDAETDPVADPLPFDEVVTLSVSPWRREKTDGAGKIELARDPRRRGAIEVHSGRASSKGPATAPLLVIPTPDSLTPPPPTPEGEDGPKSGRPVIDLGSHAVPTIRLLAGGVVVDVDGNPLSAAKIRLYRVSPPVNGRTQRPRSLVSAKTDEAGRFTMLGGDPGPGDLVLRAFKKGYYGDGIPVSLGASDVTLELLATASVLGRVRCLPHLEARPKLRLWEESGGEQRALRRVSYEKDGSFSAEGLRAGTYTLEVEIAGILVRSVGGIVVNDGESVRPVGLQDLIVGHDLIRERGVVRGPDGQPVPKVSVKLSQVLTNGVRSARSRRTGRDGSFGILAHRGIPRTIQVDAKGCQRYLKTLPVVPPVIELAAIPPKTGGEGARGRDERPARFVLAFRERIPKLKDIDRIEIRATPPAGLTTEKKRRPFSRRTRTNALSVSLGTPPPGDWDVTLYLRGDRRTINGVRRRPEATIPLGRITVPPDRNGTVRIPLTAREVTRAWEDARR